MMSRDERETKSDRSLRSGWRRLRRQRQLRPPEGGRYKFKGECTGWWTEDRRYKFTCNTPAVKIVAHTQKAVPRKLAWVVHEISGKVKGAQLKLAATESNAEAAAKSETPA
jgi:hypothetical protein